MFSIPMVIPFKFQFWVSLESYCIEFDYSTAFFKKTSRIGRGKSFTL